MAKNDPIVLYICGNCPSCMQMTKMVKAGLCDKFPVTIVDVTSEQFKAEKKVLKKVPVSLRGEEEVKIKLDKKKNKLVLQCPEDPVYIVEYDCKNCAHTLADHKENTEGELKCSVEGCTCVGFEFMEYDSLNVEVR